MSSTRLNVTELDFDQIKLNLKSYFLRSNSKFKDWDFEGSGLSTFIDVLAYNTHYNAMLAHAAMNETFIDSAQLRSNVVSRAHLLGYTPKSITAPRATVDTVFSFGDTPTSFVDPVEIARGSTFTTTYNEQPYTYTVLGTQIAIISSSGTYEFTQDASKSIELAQGVLETATYIVDNAVPRQFFEIKSKNADMSTLRVTVKESSTSTNGAITYNQFSSLYGVTGDSQIFFLNERADGIYRVYFGDGYYGQKLGNLNVVTLEYIVTAGEESNGADTFTFASAVTPLPSGLSALSVTTLSASSGGAVEESIESIRYNAPRSLVTQNRAVTAEDYITLISESRNDLESITVWGGDQEELPDETNSSGVQIHAGKVYISAKPYSGFSYTPDAKAEILALIDTRRVITAKPAFVDPDYVYLALRVFFAYDYRATALTYNELDSLVRSTVISYTDDVLEKFTGVFRHSKLLTGIDTCSPAIINSAIALNSYKYTPSTASLRNPEITDVKMDYSTPLYGDFSYDLATETSIYSDETGTLSPSRISTVTVSRVGAVVTVDDIGHPYVLGALIDVTDCTTVEYNGQYGITSVTDDTYTYDITTTPAAGPFSATVTGRPVSQHSVRAVRVAAVAGDIYPLYVYDRNVTTGAYTLTNYEDDGYPADGGWPTWPIGYVDVGSGIIHISGDGARSTAAALGYIDLASVEATNLLKMDNVFFYGKFIADKILLGGDSSEAFRIWAKPAGDIIAPRRNILLSSDLDELSVSGAIDTIVTGGAAGASKFTTFNRE